MTTESAPITTGEPILLRERERKRHATRLIDAYTQTLRSQPEFVATWLDRFEEAQNPGSLGIGQSATFTKDGITYHVGRNVIPGQKVMSITTEELWQGRILKRELTLETGRVHWQGERALTRSTISYRDNSDHYMEAARRSFSGLKPLGENTQLAVQKAEEILARLSAPQS